MEKPVLSVVHSHICIRCSCPHAVATSTYPEANCRYPIEKIRFIEGLEFVMGYLPGYWLRFLLRSAAPKFTINLRCIEPGVKRPLLVPFLEVRTRVGPVVGAGTTSN